MCPALALLCFYQNFIKRGGLHKFKREVAEAYQKLAG